MSKVMQDSELLEGCSTKIKAKNAWWWLKSH